MELSPDLFLKSDLFLGFVKAPEFTRFMSNRENATAFLSKVCSSFAKEEVSTFLDAVIYHDHNDVSKSAPYLWSFRKAVLENNVPVTKALVYNEKLNYSDSLLATIMEIDSRHREMFSNYEFITPDSYAYCAVLERIQKRNPKFFDEYMRFRILAYKNQEELGVNLIISGETYPLRYVADLPKMQTIIYRFTEANSGDAPKIEHLTDLTIAAGRYPKPDEIGSFLERVESSSQPYNVPRKEVVDAMNSCQAKWPRIQSGEFKLNALLVKLRQILLDLSKQLPLVGDGTEQVKSSIDKMLWYRTGKDQYLDSAVDYYVLNTKKRFMLQR